MHLPDIVYLSPNKTTEALEVIEDCGNSCSVIAGGTDLMVALKQRLQTPKYLIGLENIPEFKKIEEKDESIRLGPMNTLDEISSSDLIKTKLPALSQAAREVGSPLLRSQATIGGNVCLNTRCRFYNQSQFWRSTREKCYKAGCSYCHVTKHKEKCNDAFVADIVPVLIAYGENIKLAGLAGEKMLSLKEFYTGDSCFPNQILNGDRVILTEIDIPIPKNNIRSVYKKFRFRRSIDFPLVGVAVSLDLDENNRCRDINILLTGVGSAPVEIKKAKKELLGQRWDDELVSSVASLASQEIRPLKTNLVSPRYTREIASLKIKEALQEAGGKNGKNY